VKHGAVLILALSIAACSAKGDQPQDVNPSPLGNGMRMRDVQDPSKNACSGQACAGQSVKVTSVVVTAVDNFDETQNGKSRGTIYVQDADIAGPYAGISMYSPTYVPAERERTSAASDRGPALRDRRTRLWLDGWQGPTADVRAAAR